ncbi:Rieske (2Fe-2S) protein [Streptomyces albus subsp. chlorinus]|nr:Rieske (2Fe-2S) protein [Streptomyces albus subsp. chlorinus]
MLCGAALAALGLTAAACGGGGSGGSGASEGPDEPVDLGDAKAVPVGGAKLYAEQKVLVSQPEEGDFKGFSAVCTHQGSLLGEVDGDVAVCPMHGSRFHVDTGEVAKGPATQALPSVPVKVRGGKLIAGPES